MIAKKYRLREHEVSRVFKKGRPYFGIYWTMNCLKMPRANFHRIAISISRKHDKRAVQRNRYRRGLYDALLPIIRHSEETISPSQGSSISHHQSGFHCVFTLKKGLKILDKKMPDAWIVDARDLIHKLGINQK